MKYEINENTKRNLMGFLARVDLKGQEVPMFNQVLQVLNQPIQEGNKKDGEKKDDGKPEKPKVQ